MPFQLFQYLGLNRYVIAVIFKTFIMTISFAGFTGGEVKVKGYIHGINGLRRLGLSESRKFDFQIAPLMFKNLDKSAFLNFNF